MIEWDDLKNGIAVSRFFNKCERLDFILENMGKQPVAFKAKQRYIKPLMPLSEQARNAQNLEKAIDGLLITLRLINWY